MSNFEFLQDCYPEIFRKMKRAESRVFTEPKSAAHYSRLALEESIQILYKEEQLDWPYDTGLANLVREAQQQNVIPSEFKEALIIIRKTGNAGAHYGQKVKGRDALISVQYLFSFLKWFNNLYADREPESPSAFDKSFIPKVGSEKRRTANQQQVEVDDEKAKMQAQIDALLKQLEEQQEEAKASELAFKTLEKEKEKIKEELAAKKAARIEKISSEFNEAETRLHLIDWALREAGWDHLREGREMEYPVTGMPITNDNPAGNGFVDYVLWDDNGLPLALIEAKRTSTNPENGRHQAWLYANCLENTHGQRPVIFYTNGYRTYMWDDTFYSFPRRVYGFYTKDELQWGIQRKRTRKNIRNAKINTDITDRPYQREAIKRVAESMVTLSDSGELRGAKRNALLVMATGSGKTRVSASIVDVLFKNNWVKRVLFLADRNALVTQAKNAYAEHLPEISSIDLTQEKENNVTRLVFSTYQSIINKIDGEKVEDERFYGVGHFDLIIVDEAHRSVYNKYGIIFEYFDSLLLGLTATPKKEIDHNTYELFDCSEGNPTFAYELEDAVSHGWLVPYKNIGLSTEFLREGIKYKDLSEEDKAKYEEEFRDDATGLFPEHIRQSALNKWLFNKDTINKILDALMEHGLKIEGGDKIGRTIIFAANQNHADYILECFEERYPHYSSGFMAVVHNKKSHAQSIILAFCDHHKENPPQIAVSVDMMDTGIDAPRVLNLVLFKVVRSYSKFWQMIGRGTRLCPNVFGPGMAKKEFLILDMCGNFEFFDEQKQGHEAGVIKPITQQIFITRLSVARLLLETGDEADRQLSEELIDLLHSCIKTLDKSRFDVNMKREFVDEFEVRNRWNRLDSESIHNIEEHLSKLPIPESINEKARRFDLMMLKMMQANLLLLDTEKAYQENLIAIATELSKKYSIPHVKRSKLLIETLQNPDFYKALKQRKMEEIRTEIRELVQYLEDKGRSIVMTDYSDSDVEIVRAAESQVPYGNELYKRQVERFIRENKNNITISKLNTNRVITDAELAGLQRILFDGDERGTYERYKEVYGDQPLGKFIRSIVGLDIQAAQQEFSDFLQAGNLSADQIKFIDNIIQHLTINGTIDKRLLFKTPFNEAHNDGLVGLFDDNQAGKIISLIDQINQNAEVG